MGPSKLCWMFWTTCIPLSLSTNGPVCHALSPDCKGHRNEMNATAMVHTNISVFAILVFRDNDHLVWFKDEFMLHTALSNENSEDFLKKVGVPSCSADVTHHSCANFECEVADVNNGIPFGFRTVKCVVVWYYQLYHESILWYIQFV